MNLNTLVVSAMVAAGILIGWKKEDDRMISNPESNGAINEVLIQNSELNPTFITVSINTTVTWINKDQFSHCIASIGVLFDSGSLNSGNTYSYKFTSAGNYFYHCPIHSNMTGEVIVQ